MKSHITACCLALALAGPAAAAEAPAGGAPGAPDAAAIKDIKAYCLDFNWAVTGRKHKPFASPGTWADADVWNGKDGFVTPSTIESLRKIGSTEGFKPYDGNPILKPGPEGSFDAGALGSVCVLRVGDVFHLYYMYYWYGWDEPQAFKLVTSATPTGFDLNKAKTLTKLHYSLY